MSWGELLAVGPAASREQARRYGFDPAQCAPQRRGAGYRSWPVVGAQAMRRGRPLWDLGAWYRHLIAQSRRRIWLVLVVVVLVLIGLIFGLTA